MDDFVRNRGPESKATNPDLQQQKRRSQRTSRQIQDTRLPAQPFPGAYLVYAAGNIVGEDKESIYNSIHELNNHPKIQKQCRLLEMSGQEFLQHSSSHILALLINSTEAGNLLRGNGALHAMHHMEEACLPR